jgi:flagella basal body P-ring formation protein FlgA
MTPRRRNYTWSGEGRVRGFVLMAAMLVVAARTVIPEVSSEPRDAAANVFTEAMAASIRGFLASNLRIDAGGLDVRVLGGPAADTLPAGELRFTVAQKSLPGNFRRMLILMEAASELGQKRTFWVIAEGRVTARVVRAAQPLKYGAAVTAADVTEQSGELRSTRSRYFNRSAEVVGMVLRRNVAAGEPLTLEDLAEPVLVKSGQTVTLKAGSGGMQLSTLARAEQNGRLGQIIRVRNLESARLVNARVIGAGEVRVN